MPELVADGWGNGEGINLIFLTHGSLRVNVRKRIASLEEVGENKRAN